MTTVNRIVQHARVRFIFVGLPSLSVMIPRPPSQRVISHWIIQIFQVRAKVIRVSLDFLIFVLDESGPRPDPNISRRGRGRRASIHAQKTR
jgi:hypothetical protein